MLLGREAYMKWLAEVVVADTKGAAKGITHITMNPGYWQKIGCPTIVKLADGRTIPISPTGRKPPGWVKWYYKRRRNRR